MKKLIKNLIKITIVTAAVLQVINKFIESNALHQLFKKSSAGKYFSWRDTKIYYEKHSARHFPEAEEKRPLLLLHDLHPFSSCKEWSKVIDVLCEDRDVYCLDLPGCGCSDKPCITYTAYYYTLFLNAFLEEVIGEKTDICADGRSGSLAVLAAAQNPELCGDLILCNPPEPADLEKAPGKMNHILKELMNLPIFGTSFYYALTSEAEISRRLSEELHPGTDSEELAELRYAASHTGKGHGKYLYSSLVNGYVNNTIRYALPKTEGTIRLLFSEDHPSAKDTAAAYQKLNSGITWDILKKAGMLPMWESPSEFIRLLDPSVLSE